ncbi:unnamed protein product [Amoebophrya sp. A120]|nr:unnamed protein product [Amoebophrya sp. A120]|eukprot:GSA120T00014369001.1
MSTVRGGATSGSFVPRRDDYPRHKSCPWSTARPSCLSFSSSPTSFFALTLFTVYLRSAFHVLPVAAFGCFSDYSMSWCNNHTEESCVHDYTFSVSHFQRKLNKYYQKNHRPPLLEAYFLIKTPQPYQAEFLDADCAPPLIMALLLVCEARMEYDSGQAVQLFELAMNYLQNRVSPEQAYILTNTDTWPFKKAVARIQTMMTELEQRKLKIEEKLAVQKQPRIKVDFVISHCKEQDLNWLVEDLTPMLVTGQARETIQPKLLVYEKCHQVTDVGKVFEQWNNYQKSKGNVQKIATENPFDLDPSRNPVQGSYEIVPTPDPSFVARGDECSAYLKHIRNSFGGGGGFAHGDEMKSNTFADFTFFLHSDPWDHMHKEFMSVILSTIAAKTFDSEKNGFLHLNGPRHVRTLTPCLQAVSEKIFGFPVKNSVGPYCCAQFMVTKERILKRPQSFYSNMLTMVNGTMTEDLCTSSKTARSTHCYGMEFLWHLVFSDLSNEELQYLNEQGSLVQQQLQKNELQLTDEVEQQQAMIDSVFDPPLRPDDWSLPIQFRLKFGVEHAKKDWNDVVLSPNVPKKIVTRQDWNGNEFVYTLGGEQHVASLSGKGNSSPAGSASGIQNQAQLQQPQHQALGSSGSAASLPPISVRPVSSDTTTSAGTGTTASVGASSSLSAAQQQLRNANAAASMLNQQF